MILPKPKRKALIFRPINPTGPLVCSTKRLVEGLLLTGNWSVGWIWGPLPLTLLHPHGQHGIGICNYIKGGEYINPAFWHYVPLTYRPYIRGCPERWLFSALEATSPSLTKKLKACGMYKVDLLLIESPTMVSALNICKAKLVVYHCTGAFHRFKSFPMPVLKAHSFLLHNVDLIVTVSHGIKKDLISNYSIPSEKVHVIEHGSVVSCDRHIPVFGQAKSTLGKKPIAMLIGIPETTDIELLQNLVNKAKNFHFIVIGPFGLRERCKFRKFPNIDFLGLLEHEKAMKILSQGTVGLILYKKDAVERLAEGSKTMKIYDYAGAGLPIVSVPLPITDELLPIQFARDPEEFVRALEYCVEHKKELQTKAIAFARSNSWGKRQAEFIKLVEDMLEAKEG